MENVLGLLFGNTMVNVDEFLYMSKVTLQAIGGLEDLFIALVGEQVLLVPDEALKRSSEFFVRPAHLSGEWMSGFFVEEGSVALFVVLHAHMEHMTVGVRKTLYKGKQHASCLGLRMSGGAAYHQTLHMHVAHLEGNPMKG